MRPPDGRGSHWSPRSDSRAKIIKKQKTNLSEVMGVGELNKAVAAIDSCKDTELTELKLLRSKIIHNENCTKMSIIL